MKTQIQELINKLAKATEYSEEFGVSKVNMGEVLKAMYENNGVIGRYCLVDLWAKAGLTTSLNQMAEGEWETDTYKKCEGLQELTVFQYPKDKAVKDLFEFLLSLNL